MDDTQKMVLGGIIVLAIIAIVFYFKSRNVEVKEAKQERAPAQMYQQDEPEPHVHGPNCNHQKLPPQQPENRGVLVMFFAPWCGHCKNLEPLWDELVQNFDGYNGIKIAKINGSEHPQLMEAHGVKGFPTVKYCPYGVESPEGVIYNGDRSMNSLIEFLQNC